MRQWHAGVQRGRRFDPQGSALSEQRGHRVLLRFRNAATQVPWPAVLVVGRARALALLAPAARPLRWIGGGEQLRQRRARGCWHRHRVLRHPSWLRPWLPSRCQIYTVMFEKSREKSYKMKNNSANFIFIRKKKNLSVKRKAIMEDEMEKVRLEVSFVSFPNSEATHKFDRRRATTDLNYWAGWAAGCRKSANYCWSSPVSTRGWAARPNRSSCWCWWWWRTCRTTVPVERSRSSNVPAIWSPPRDPPTPCNRSTRSERN